MANTGDLAARSRLRPFRVRAESLEDMEMISSMLQDAVVPISEIAFDRRSRRFALMTQRFRWELLAANSTTAGEPGVDAGQFERVFCALRFENVLGVRSHGINLASRGQMLELLSMHLGEKTVDMAFADDKTIRLIVDSIDCHIEDLGRPWPTRHRPSHPDIDG